ncbi:MAG TPA: ATP-dependent RecD-like DNA helicase [Minicystis sp.]|nr:ATP-dependent RecD-like DNA helicase [Minicystis sp.]
MPPSPKAAPARRGPQQRGLFRPPPRTAKPPSVGVPVTVEGEIARVAYESEAGFRVVRVDVEGRPEQETWVGVFPSATPGSRVRATGKYEKDPKHGYQLRVETLIAVAPATIEGLERYLGSGIAKGVGPAWAKRVVETFGLETLDVLDRTPERLHEVPGLGARRVDAVTRAWAERRAVGAIMVFLQSHGVSPALASRIYRRFGAHAIEIVSRAPYRLALDVWGVGFKTADAIARSLGVGEDAPERAQAGVLQTLHDLSSKGHVYAERAALARIAAAMLGRDEADASAAIDALADSKHVVVEALGGGEAAVYKTDLHDAEVRLARRLRVLIEQPATKHAELLAKGAAEAIGSFEQKTGVTLAPAQREAVELAAKHRVVVVTGGPGVGKTTIVRAILSVFARAKLDVRLAAPTGRAAKRMTEATGRQAVTLHRLLEFDPKKREFSRQRARPIDADALVVDESSMLDLSLADALLQAVANDARLVLVGDVDQLPSVGPGAVLRDVIASRRVPTARLTQIFRQAEGSLIVSNAHKIHAGQLPESAGRPDGEFFVLPRTEATAAADAILEVVTKRIPQRFGLDPRRDVQVLTPMHRGDAGATVLNERLQKALNPEGAEVTRGSRTLRQGDKVMQLRNDYDKEVFNGDLGFVTSVDPAERELTVRFDDREVKYEEGELDELALAYATSIHKSQGSEYPAVVVPILTQHFVMLSRNLLYTAVTRGKRLVVLVADPRALSIALAEVRKEERMTRLADRIRAV